MFAKYRKHKKVRGQRSRTPPALNSLDSPSSAQEKPREEVSIWTRQPILNSPFPRYRHVAAHSLAPNDSLFIMGGLHSGSVYGDTWSISLTRGIPPITAQLVESFESIPAPRVGHSCVMLGNAFIVFGGDTVKSSPTGDLDNDLYLLNTNTYKWTIPQPIGPRPTGRYGHTMCVISATLLEPKLYVYGGQLDETIFDDLCAFNLSTFRSPDSHWEVVETSNSVKPPPRTNHIMVTWNNRLIAIGGFNGKVLLNDVWSYDPVRNVWSEIKTWGNKPQPTEEAAAVVIEDKLFMYGGKLATGVKTSQLSCLDLTSGGWYSDLYPPAMNYTGPGPRCGHTMTATEDGRIIILGGDFIDPQNVPTADSFGVGSDMFILDTKSLHFHHRQSERSFDSQLRESSIRSNSIRDTSSSTSTLKGDRASSREVSIQEQRSGTPQPQLPTVSESTVDISPSVVSDAVEDASDEASSDEEPITPARPNMLDETNRASTGTTATSVSTVSRSVSTNPDSISPVSSEESVAEKHSLREETLTPLSNGSSHNNNDSNVGDEGGDSTMARSLISNIDSAINNEIDNNKNNANTVPDIFSYNGLEPAVEISSPATRGIQSSENFQPQSQPQSDLQFLDDIQESYHDDKSHKLYQALSSLKQQLDSLRTSSQSQALAASQLLQQNELENKDLKSKVSVLDAILRKKADQEENFKKQLDEIKDNKEKVDQELTDANNELVSVRSQLETEKAANSEKDSTIEQLQAHLEENSKLLDDSKEENDYLRVQLDSQHEQLVEFDTLKSEVETLREKLESKDRDLNDFEISKSEIADFKQELEEKNLMLNEFEVAKTELDALKEQLAEFEDTKAEIESLKAEAAERAEKLEENQKVIDDLQNDIQILNSKVRENDTLMSDYQNSLNNITELEDKLDTTTKELENVKETAAKTIQTKEVDDDNYKKAKSAAANLEAKVSDLIRRLETSTLERIAMSAKLNQLRAENKDFKVKVRNLEPLVDENINGLVEMSNALKTATARSQSLEQRLSEQNSVTVKLEETIQNLENELEQHRSINKEDSEQWRTDRDLMQKVKESAEKAVGSLSTIKGIWTIKQESGSSEGVSRGLSEEGGDEVDNESSLQEQVDQLLELTARQRENYGTMQNQLNDALGSLQTVRASNNNLIQELQLKDKTISDVKEHLDDMMLIKDQRDALEANYREAIKSVRNTSKALSMTRDELQRYKEQNASIMGELEKLRLLKASIMSRHGKHERRSIDIDGEGDENAGNETETDSEDINISEHYNLRLRDLQAQLIIAQEENEELTMVVSTLKRKLLHLQDRFGIVNGNGSLANTPILTQNPVFEN